MQTTTVREATPTAAWSKIALGLAFLIGVVFVGGTVFPYFRLTEAALGPYSSKPVWLVAHISAGTVALLLGPFVLGLGLNRRRMHLHRNLGAAYMVAIVISSAASFYLAFTTEISWVFGMGLSVLGVVWLTTTSLAFLAIRKRLIGQHKEWMIRSYVVTLSFVNFRILVGIFQVTGLGNGVEQFNAASWLCWAFPLVLTEAILQGKKIVASPAVTR